jgi:hypothetical protein
MNKINWGRMALGALVAAVICFMSDGFLHNALLKADWTALFEALRAPSPGHDPMAFVYFGLFEMGRAFVSLFLYVMMRSRFGAGPRTAVGAGCIAWVAFSFTGPVQMIPLGLFSVALWIKMGAYQLLTSILSTLAGAALYKEGKK